MNVLSLFDGISCGQIALNRAGIKYDNYFSSEIDKYAIKVTQHNYPNTVQLGDVTSLDCTQLPKIDLLMGGSPCQGFSVAGKQLNFEDVRSKLFFEFVRILNESKPTYFLLENVKMNNASRDIISSYLGVEPILINSSLVSAQKRNRLYWTNIPNVAQPLDRNITLKDVMLDSGDPLLVRKVPTQKRMDYIQRKIVKGFVDKPFNEISTLKSECLLATMHKNMQNFIFNDDNGLRFYTPIEIERLQTVPDNYTDMVSDTQRFRSLGNGWTVDIIAHIFKNIVQ